MTLIKGISYLYQQLMLTKPYIGYNLTIKESSPCNCYLHLGYHSNQYRNMNGLIGLISLSAFLLIVSGQFPSLSPSYSYQGALVRSVDGNQILTATYRISVDIDRRLQFVDESETLTAGGVVSNNLRLSSENDSATYLSVNNVCTETAFDPNIYSPINTNVWDLYAAGTESPVGTYTFSLGGLTCQVTIVNGEPASFTFSFNTTVIAIAITNFDNMTPALSTFSLPSECSQFSCNACYSSAVSVSISIMLLLTTLLIYLFTTL